MENLSLQAGVKRIRNTISTKDVLKHNPELRKAVEAKYQAREVSDGKDKNKRLPNSLRIAIRNAKRELGKEFARKESENYARIQQQRQVEQAKTERLEQQKRQNRYSSYRPNYY